MIQTQGRGVVIGLRDVYTAILLSDPSSGKATYDTPIRVSGAIQANVNPNSSLATLFADDGPYETAATIGEITLELNLADIPLETQALWFGHTIEGGILKRRAGDVPPWVAVGFRSLKSNGKYRYTWLAKGKFSLPEQSNQTKGDSIEFSTPTVTGNFVKRECDDEWERHIDEDHIDYTPEQGANWFVDPYGGEDMIPAGPPQVTNVSPSSSGSPSSSVVWTFDKPLSLSTVHTGNFVVIDQGTGKGVKGALTINSARTQVTFKPTSGFSSGKIYTAIVSGGVKSLRGIEMVQAHASEFSIT